MNSVLGMLAQIRLRPEEGRALLYYLAEQALIHEPAQGFDQVYRALFSSPELEPNAASAFLAQIFSAEADGRSEDAVFDSIFDQVDSWMLDGRMHLCDAVFEELLSTYFSRCVEKPALSIGFLTISGPVRDSLPHRQTFLERFRRAMIESRGDAETQDLLQGL